MSETLDFYGFRIEVTAAQQAVRARCDSEDDAVARKWTKYGKRKTLPVSDSLKKLCRKGIPAEHRAWAWLEISGANRRKSGRVAGYYDAMVSSGVMSSACAHQIELDLPRTFPTNTWVRTDEAIKSLRRVLLAYSVHNPRVGYCQSMNFLAAMLLLAMKKDEENVFWMMVSLIDDGILYRDMYASNLIGTHVEMQSLQGLLVQKLPKLAQHFDKLGCDISMIATDWFLCLFCTTLPSETVMRVWDALFSEGSKILFRVALALMKINEPQLLAQDNPGFVLQQMKQASMKTFDRHQLMKVAFDGIGSFPMAKITTLRAQKQVELGEDFRKRESKKALRAAIQQGTHMQVVSTTSLTKEVDRVKKSYSGLSDTSIPA